MANRLWRVTEDKLSAGELLKTDPYRKFINAEYVVSIEIDYSTKYDTWVVMLELTNGKTVYQRFSIRSDAETFLENWKNHVEEAG